jgi:hypothetical protein
MLSCSRHALHIETSLQKIKVNIEQKSAKTVRTEKFSEYLFFTLSNGGLASGHIHPPPSQDRVLYSIFFLLQSVSQVHLRTGSII